MVRDVIQYSAVTFWSHIIQEKWNDPKKRTVYCDLCELTLEEHDTIYSSLSNMNGTGVSVAEMLN